MSYDPSVTFKKVVTDALVSGGIAFGLAVLTWLQGADLSTLHIPIWALPLVSAGTTGAINYLKNFNRK